MSHGPIEQEHLKVMNDIGRLLDAAINKGEKPRRYGFTLLVFGLNTTEGRMNYISNASRADMLVALKEFIAHNEGRVQETDTPQ
jgi:predicted component of type VI protein secretion system